MTEKDDRGMLFGEVGWAFVDPTNVPKREVADLSEIYDEAFFKRVEEGLSAIELELMRDGYLVVCEWCQNPSRPIVMGSNEINDCPPICRECLERGY